MSALDVLGVTVWPGWLAPESQQAMVEDIRKVVAAAPLFVPVTPRGRPMSVRMTAAGEFGWITDRSGYRYARRHPSGQPWTPIPPSVLAV